MATGKLNNENLQKSSSGESLALIFNMEHFILKIKKKTYKAQ